MRSIFLRMTKSGNGPRTVSRRAKLQTQWRDCLNSNGAHPWTDVRRAHVPIWWHSTQAGTIGQCSASLCRRIGHPSARLNDRAETLPADFDTAQGRSFKQRPYRFLSKFTGKKTRLSANTQGGLGPAGSGGRQASRAPGLGFSQPAPASLAYPNSCTRNGDPNDGRVDARLHPAS
jgi:hypothetical protein